MAFKFLKNLFSKKNRGHIVLTPEEAYAPLPEETSGEPHENTGEIVPAPDAVSSVVIEPAPEPVPSQEPAGEMVFEVGEAPEEEAPKEEENVQPPYEIWLYACLDDPDSAKLLVRPGMISAYHSLQEDEKGFTGTLNCGAKVKTDVRSDISFVSEQAAYLKSRYKDTFLADRDVQNAAMMQIELFNVFFRFEMSAPYSKSDISALIDAVYSVAEPIRAFVLNSEMELSRWDKRLVISLDGRTDFNVFMPIRRRTPQVSQNETQQADEARKNRSIEQLKKRGITLPINSPVQIRESDAKLKSPEEIIRRMAAVFACSLKAQAYTSPREVASPAEWSMNAIKRLDAQYGVTEQFTHKEAEYARRAIDSQHQHHLLRFESCQVLLWALGLSKLGWPDEKCDLNFIMRIIRDADTEVLMRIAKPRPLNQILDMHDITFRLHSLCVLGNEKAETEAHVDHDVVYERHYALNWLVSVDGISDWDLVVPKI